MKKLISWDDVALKLPDVVRDWIDARSDTKIEAQHTTDNSVYVTVVDNGADPNFPRPVGSVVVYWTGSVIPINALDTDLRYVAP